MAKFIVETSARHIHVTQEVLEQLCGEGFQLEVRGTLSQPGQFVSTTRLDVVGPKNTIKNVSILGPVRDHCQVEISATDSRTLGISAPIRESGDIEGSPAVTLVNNETGKSVTLEKGLIVAKRHVHMTPEDAKEFGVENGQIVSVEVDSGKGRKIVFGDTVIRVSKNYALAMHIDTDESNAGCCFGEVYGEIVK